MKKIFYIALALLTCTVTFTSCEEEDDFGNSNYEIVDDAAAAVAGTYTGTWTRTLNGVDETQTGTITLSTTDASYYVNVTFSEGLESFGVSAVTVKSNISQQGDRFIIVNPVSTNDQGTSFRMYVEDGNLTGSFVKTIKNGRLSYEYSYAFDGNK